MKITKFDKPTCRRVSERVIELLRPLEEELGVKISPARGGKYIEDASFCGVFEFALVKEDGTVETKDRVAFRENAILVGLKEEDLDKTFTTPDGRTYTIVGLAPASYKRPILVVDKAGKRWKFEAEKVAFCLKREAA